MSMIPMGGNKPSPNPWLAENYPASLLTMGLTAERVARHYDISREDQDAFALFEPPESSRCAGRRTLRRKRLIPVRVAIASPEEKPASLRFRKRSFLRRRGPARGYFCRSTRQLKPVFHAQGTVTAGNSSQTSDGAAAVVLIDAGARAANLALSRWRGCIAYAVTGCLPEEMGIGPITAFPRRSSLPDSR